MDPIAIPLFALIIPIVVAPTAMGFRYAQKLRELEHAERMRALELGRLLPQDEPWTTPTRIVAAIGAGVPIAALMTAFATSRVVGFHESVWAACGSVGVSGIVGGTYLATRHLFGRGEESGLDSKLAHDPDSLDVVSRRG